MSVKPMNCPGHFLMFASEVRSYRDLPIRFHEQTPLHRNEASGVLSGLTRVRQFSQDDAHCFVTQEQIGEEVERLLRLVQRVYGDFGLPFTAKLSTRPDEFLGEIATWDHAEAQLKAALERAGHGLHASTKATARSTARRSTSTSPTRSAGSGSAPRFSSTTSSRSNFDLKYIGADNAEHRPVVIHRAIFGSFERFIAILIEHYAGAFPLWLAPVQAIVLPIADRHLDYARGGPRRGSRRPGCASSSTSARRRLDIRSVRPSCRRSPTCWSSAIGKPRKGTVSVRSRERRRPGRAAGRRVRRRGAAREVATQAGQSEAARR